MYYIWNLEDRITATGDNYSTKEEAEEMIPLLRDRYRKQGYYRDNNWNKILPDDIRYEVRECDIRDYGDEHYW